MKAFGPFVLEVTFPAADTFSVQEPIWKDLHTAPCSRDFQLLNQLVSHSASLEL